MDIVHLNFDCMVWLIISHVCNWYSTLALVVDLLGGDNFVDDCLEEVVLPCHPGWKTGDVQLLVTNGVIQR